MTIEAKGIGIIARAIGGRVEPLVPESESGTLVIRGKGGLTFQIDKAGQRARLTQRGELVADGGREFLFDLPTLDYDPKSSNPDTIHIGDYQQEVTITTAHDGGKLVEWRRLDI